MGAKKYLVVVFDDEACLLPAVQSVQEQGARIYDVFTPFCVHGLDKILKLKEPSLHILGFIYGSIGALLSFFWMAWVLLSDWPITYGGKPFWSVPSLIPLSFEFMVLFAVLGMGLTFFHQCNLAPGLKRHHFHPRVTDDRMAVVLDLDENTLSEEDLTAFFKEKGALSAEVQTVNTDWYWGLYRLDEKTV